MAALSISGVPGGGGYLSKTLLHEGLLEAIHVSGVPAFTEWIFLLSGGLTFCYMCKLYLCLFHRKNADPVRQAPCALPDDGLTPLSSAVLLLSAGLLLPWGVPGAALRLSAWMTGLGPVHLRAFSLHNLSGALISLSLGAAVYLGFVRPVLCRGGVYRDLWPHGLDLERSVYRPLLLRVLPGVLGPIARLFGENLLLRPLCRGLYLLGSIVGRALDCGTDFLILLLRRTLLREAPLPGSQSRRQRPLRDALSAAFGGMTDSFSFAMMFSCAGVLLVFVLLLLFF